MKKCTNKYSESENKNLVEESLLIDDFKGKNVKEVIKKLNEQNLDYEVVGSEGIYVANQMPIAGTLIENGVKVYLYLSDEKKDEKVELISVPSVLDLNIEQAMDLLKKNNFECVIVNEKNEDDENAENGNKLKVIEQMPEAGVKLESGTQIRLKVK